MACGGDEAAGCGYVVEYGDEAEGVVDDAELLEEDKVDDGDEGWLVQVVGGGSAGDGAKKVPVSTSHPLPKITPPFTRRSSMYILLSAHNPWFTPPSCTVSVYTVNSNSVPLSGSSAEHTLFTVYAY